MTENRTAMDETVFFAYDTLCRVSVLPPSGSDVNLILEDARDTAHLVEQTLSMFDEKSELSVLCKSYEKSVPYPVSEMLYSFLEFNLKIAELTEGHFDFTVGALIKLWNFLAEDPEIPERNRIDQLLSSVGYKHISLIPDKHSVVIDCDNIQLDPGASGKGFALDIVEKQLRSYGVESAVLDFGGNIFTIGGKTIGQDSSTRSWITALRSPFDPNVIIGSVPLFDSGVATTSWYEHCFKKDGALYYHILDPFTGYPLPLELRSVSIISSSALFTDALSTAFFVIGLEKGSELVSKLRGSIEGKIEFVAVLDNQKIVSSPCSGFLPYP